KALGEPLRWIAENAGVQGYVVVEKVKEAGPGTGYNAATGTYGDIASQGVIDPVKVTRSALANAGSIAGMLLTTETLVVDKPEDEEAAGAGAGHGHSHCAEARERGRARPLPSVTAGTAARRPPLDSRGISVLPGPGCPCRFFDLSRPAGPPRPRMLRARKPVRTSRYRPGPAPGVAGATSGRPGTMGRDGGRRFSPKSRLPRFLARPVIRPRTRRDRADRRALGPRPGRVGEHRRTDRGPVRTGAARGRRPGGSLSGPDRRAQSDDRRRHPGDGGPCAVRVRPGGLGTGPGDLRDRARGFGVDAGAPGLPRRGRGAGAARPRPFDSRRHVADRHVRWPVPRCRGRRIARRAGAVPVV